MYSNRQCFIHQLGSVSSVYVLVQCTEAMSLEALRCQIPLELELQALVSQNVGAGYLDQGSLEEQPLIYLSSPDCTL